MYQAFTVVEILTMAFVVLAAIAVLPRGLLVKTAFYAAGIAGVSPMGREAVTSAVFLLPIVIMLAGDLELVLPRLSFGRKEYAEVPAATTDASRDQLPDEVAVEGDWIPRCTSRRLESLVPRLP